jgi:hypothetical protein
MTAQPTQPTIDKEKASQIISVVISALIALLAIFGYNIFVVQPAFEDLEAAPASVSRGITHFTALQTDQLQANQLYVTNVITDTTLTADSCGTYITNAGAVLTPTLTLPALSTATNCAMCFHTATAQLWYLDPSGADRIAVLTDTNGDKLSNATAGNSICLLGNGSSTWYAITYEGAWSDAN